MSSSSLHTGRVCSCEENSQSGRASLFPAYRHVASRVPYYLRPESLVECWLGVEVFAGVAVVSQSPKPGGWLLPRTECLMRKNGERRQDTRAAGIFLNAYVLNSLRLSFCPEIPTTPPPTTNPTSLISISHNHPPASCRSHAPSPSPQGDSLPFRSSGQELSVTRLLRRNYLLT